jgi:hypothetical protein
VSHLTTADVVYKTTGSPIMHQGSVIEILRVKVQDDCVRIHGYSYGWYDFDPDIAMKPVNGGKEWS